MDTALNPAAAHRSDARLHVLGPTSTASPQTVRVRAVFSLSEAGRRASLVTGGNGRRRQRLAFRIPPSRMHLVHVDHGGTPYLKLRPRFEMRADQRVVRIDAAPVYDAPPSVETLLQDAARNHELEAAYHAQGLAYRSARQDVAQSWRTQVAESFLRDPIATARKLLENFESVVCLAEKTHSSVARSVALSACRAADPLTTARLYMENYDAIVKSISRTDPRRAHRVAAEAFRSNNPMRWAKRYLAELQELG